MESGHGRRSMALGTRERPTTRRPGRPAAAMALLLLSTWAGCSALDKGRTLVPSEHHVRTGPFVVYTNSPMPENPPAVRCLEALERDVARELGLRPAAEE